MEYKKYQKINKRLKIKKQKRKKKEAKIHPNLPPPTALFKLGHQ